MSPFLLNFGEFITLGREPMGTKGERRTLVFHYYRGHCGFHKLPRHGRRNIRRGEALVFSAVQGASPRPIENHRKKDHILPSFYYEWEVQLYLRERQGREKRGIFSSVAQEKRDSLSWFDSEGRGIP